MLENIFQKHQSKLDEPINTVLREMEQLGPDTPEYQKLMDSLERLMKLQSEERSNRVSADTIAVVAGNLLGILTVVAYEQKHVWATRAFGMVLRSKQTNP